MFLRWSAILNPLYEKSLLNIPNKCVCSFFQIFVDWGWHLTHWGRKAAEFLYFYYSILALAPRDWMRGLARIWSLWHLLVIVGWQVELQTNHLWSFHNHVEGRAPSWNHCTRQPDRVKSCNSKQLVLYNSSYWFTQCVNIER